MNSFPSTLITLHQPSSMVDGRSILGVLFGLNMDKVAFSFSSTIFYGRDVILGKKVVKSKVDGVDKVDE